MKYYKYLFFGLLLLLVGETKSQDENNLSVDSLFNLGNAAFANVQFDRAIFYYEKAKLLNPGANDVVVNLQLANEKLVTEIIEIKPFFLADWWRSVCNLALPGGWKIVSILTLFCLLLLTYFHFLKFRIENKNLFYSMASILALLFFISVLAGHYRSNQIFNSPYAIVFGGDQSLFLGPDLVSEKVKQVTGGNKLKILDEDGEWYKVSAMDSEQGWIKKKDVKLIKF